MPRKKKKMEKVEDLISKINDLEPWLLERLPGSIVSKVAATIEKGAQKKAPKGDDDEENDEDE